MTALAIEMLLHYSYTTDEFPGLEQYPAQRHNLQAFCALGLLRPKAPGELVEGQARFLLTPRGRRHVEALKALPIVPPDDDA